MREAYIGVDWGTHSSKWCYQDSLDRKLVGPIWDSRVWRVDEYLVMYTMERRYKGERGERELKRKLIRDPGQAFWDGERPKLEATLGEAVVFSILALLWDAYIRLQTKDIRLSEMDNLSVRFSHPNWVTSDNVVALEYYRDAALIALSFFRSNPECSTSEDSFQIPISLLRDFIKTRRAKTPSLPPLPQLYDYEKYEAYLKGVVDDIHWQFVFESCAAGFPYLVQDEPKTFDPDDPDFTDKHWVRKLLVVDIGAGSTDSGYILRTIRRDPITKAPSGPMLIWLPPAPAFERAGNWLTDRIRADWVNEGKPASTIEEAEIYKTSGVTDWYIKQYVQEWCRSIEASVSEYLRTVPDTMRLPKTPPLEVVITGGSSAVQPIKACLKDGVIDALRNRGIGAQLSNDTILISDRTAERPGYAGIHPQLAVCLGASHPRMTELKHYPKGL